MEQEKKKEKKNADTAFESRRMFYAPIPPGPQVPCFKWASVETAAFAACDGQTIHFSLNDSKINDG